MDLKDVEHLARLVSELDIAEIEIKQFGKKVRIVKHAYSPQTVMVPHADTVPIAPPIQSPMAIGGPSQPEESSRSEAAPPARPLEVIAIKAPMVGTFYRAPAPDVPPYVEVGQMLHSGQTVCIIEAMKLMNEIHSDVKGKIISIKIENAEPVEFGQVLLEVDTSARE